MDGHTAVRAPHSQRTPLSRRLVPTLETPSSAADATGFHLGAPRILLLSAAIGLLTGFAEIALLLTRNQFEGPAASGVVHLNRHYPWMIPAANLLIFSAVGICLALLSVVVRRLAPARSHTRGAWIVWIAMACLALLGTYPALHSAAAGMLALGVAVQISAPLARHARRASLIVLMSLPASLGLLAVLAGLAHDRVVRHEPRALALLQNTAPGAPNLMFLVLDTVRADHMSLYGYERPTTPRLQQLAEERGITFNFARSPAPWTLPAHASLFTGRWPHEVNVSPRHPLDNTFPTVAEHLAAHGYATSAFVSNMYYLNDWYGLDRGFVHFEDHPEYHDLSLREVLRNAALGRKVIARLFEDPRNTREGDLSYRKRANQVNAHALEWIDAFRERHGTRPFFAFLNYLDTHDPYVVPGGVVEPFRSVEPRPGDDALIRSWHTYHAPDLDPHDRAVLIDSYDTCLAYLDHHLGQLFEALDQRGLLDNTWLVITSDHGEHLGEHGLFLHGQSLHRPVIDIPFVIVPPRGSGLPPRRIEEPVSTRELPLTIATILGVHADAPFPGRSLTRFWDAASADAPPAFSPVLSEADLGVEMANEALAHTPVHHGPMQSIAMPGITYIRRGDGLEQIFELADDPAELHNVAHESDRRSLLEALRGHLREALDHD